MTLDEAIELLEITEDIDVITEKELREKRKRAMNRWHPDKVLDPVTKARYEEIFKKIEQAVALIYEYRSGNPYAGQDFNHGKTGAQNQQQEDKMRAEAPQWKERILKVWAGIKSAGWQMSIKDRVISDGFKLKDVLDRDVKDEVMALAVSSFVYGIYAFLAALIPSLLLKFIFLLTLPALLIHSILCFLLLLPLSRLWMPNWLLTAAWFSCDKGLQFGSLIMRFFGEKRFFRVLVNWPYYFSKGLTLLVVTPIYKLIGHFLRDKVVGVKIRRERYFADFPEHYIDQLLGKEPSQMTWQELRYLSEIYHACSKFN
jgi:hypothetical protein